MPTAHREALSSPTDRDSSALRLLRSLFEAALQGAGPEGKFEGRLPQKPRGRTIVVGAGKAAARMARAFEEAWAAPCEGLVITRYGHAAETLAIEVVEAAHPVPDAAGLEATRRIIELAQSAGADDLVVALISGGASSLLTMPIEGISLKDKQQITRDLLRSGAPIGEMNQVRKALSGVKGGKLAQAAFPSRLVTYIISDVPGDDPATVGSGPTVFSQSTPREVLAILEHYQIDVPAHVKAMILAQQRPGGGGVSGGVHLIASPRMALDAAVRKAEQLGLRALLLGDAIEGEAREVAKVMAGIAKSAAQNGVPSSKPCVIISGGETTVTVRGAGRGGRNTEFLLALAIALKDQDGISGLACDTDGIDGSEDNAGAWFDTPLLRQNDLQGALASLQNNDAYSYFEKYDQLIVTGPTRTNVNDFRAILIR